MSLLADQFREARRVGAFALTSKVLAHKDSNSVQVQKASVSIKSKSEQNARPQNVNPQQKGFIPKSERRCYKCNKVGHIASECLAKSNDRKGQCNCG